MVAAADLIVLPPLDDPRKLPVKPPGFEPEGDG
jgi:hypothetical protein